MILTVPLEKITGYMQSNPYKPGYILEEEGFYLIGCSTRFVVLPKKENHRKIEILIFEEGEFTKGIWKRKRMLNGNECYKFAVYDTPKSVHLEVFQHE